MLTRKRRSPSWSGVGPCSPRCTRGWRLDWRRPRATSLEAEYVLATATAQLAWVRSVIDDLRTGRLSWTEEELKALLEDDSARQGAERDHHE
jgi:hypothetical protein